MVAQPELQVPAPDVAVLDLSVPDGAERLVDAVADLDIGLVIANAGYGLAGRFITQDTRRLQEMIQLNCSAPAVLASRLMPRLLARGRGGLIIVRPIDTP